MTCYCKKCKQDVPMAEYCPICGGSLPKTSVRVAWCVKHRPCADWLCWNAVARIVLPVWLLLTVIILLSAAGDSTLPGQLGTLVSLLVASAVILLVILILQGDDLTDCVVDSRGIHIRQYLPNPTAIKLLARFRSPALMSGSADQQPPILLTEKDLRWADIARVQLWPQKALVLLYAPSWWMRLCIYCDAYTYVDVLDYIRDKIGRKKKLLLPRELIAPPKPRAPKAARSTAAKRASEQLSMTDMFFDPTPAAPADADIWQQDTPDAASAPMPDLFDQSPENVPSTDSDMTAPQDLLPTEEPNQGDELPFA